MTTQTKKAKAGFFKGIKMELKKVSWPNKKEVSQYTAVVFAMCITVGIIIAAADFIFSSAFRMIVGA